MEELPQNWAWVKVGEVSSLLRGISYQKHQAESYERDENCLVLRGGNIQDGKIAIDSDLVYVPKELVDEKQLLRNGDIVIVGSTGSKDLIGKAALSTKDEDKISFGAFLMLIRPLEAVNKKYFGYFFLSDEYRNAIRESSGGVNINNIRREHITSLNFPLPPLPEQKRIVAKLDTLFAHLDQLKARLENIPALLKQFRQAVLTQAVTGKLTEEWRGKSNNLEKRNLVTLSSLINESANGISKRRGENGDEVIVLRLADFKDAVRVKGQERRIILTKTEAERYRLFNDDVLVIRVNGSRELAGRFILYHEEGVIETFCDHFIRLRLDKSNILPIYLIYLTESIVGRAYMMDKLVTSAGQNTINQKSISDFEFELPSVKEQKEIVRRVESLFAMADKIEASYRTLQQKIDQLPQAILAKAFRGELVEQDVLNEVSHYKEEAYKLSVAAES